MLKSLLFAFLAGCSTVTPGEVTVRVHVCGEATEADRYTVIHSGRYYSTPCKEHYQIPTREQRAVWTKNPAEGSENDESITFSGVDGQPLNVDVGIGYMVNGSSDEDIIKMVTTYGPDLARIIDSRVRDSARDALNMCSAQNKWVVQDIYGESKDELMKCAQERVQSEFNSNGLIITRMTMNSEVRLPPTIKSRMEEAQAATQEADKVRRQVEMTKAEGEKKVAAEKAAAESRELRARSEAEALKISSESQAEANKLLARSITPELLKLKEMEVRLEQAKRWDGELPDTVLSDNVPMLLTTGK